MGDTFSFKLSDEFKKFQKELDELCSLEVAIGYQQGKHYYEDADTGKKVDMADVALFNELGTARAPARPFLRQSVENHTDELSAFMQQAAKDLLAGKSAEEILDSIGAYQKGVVQREIRDGNLTPNAASTIARKGSDRPLIDTGQMRQSVNYIVRKKEES